MSHHQSSEMTKCIENCTECHNVCLETLQHCIEKGGKHGESEHLRLLQDCVDICRTSADFMLRGSSSHSDVCGICADICEECAQDCEQMAEDKQMKECAETCRRCARTCQEMASANV
jgi:hypothetical protein